MDNNQNNNSETQVQNTADNKADNKAPSQEFKSTFVQNNSGAGNTMRKIFGVVGIALVVFIIWAFIGWSNQVSYIDEIKEATLPGCDISIGKGLDDYFNGEGDWAEFDSASGKYVKYTVTAPEGDDLVIRFDIIGENDDEFEFRLSDVTYGGITFSDSDIDDMCWDIFMK